ncbi:hypothetical protein C8Q74DRAFT_992901 [Fomes fomentarius]|nr:hypothetical protein C8Q74DRAFT_992901 [Fomes fomentarius]
MADAADNAGSNSLITYLARASLPPLVLKDTLPPVQHLSSLWPRMHELFYDEPYTRAVRKVTIIPLLELQNALRAYFYGCENDKIEWENSALTLPSRGTVALGDGARQRLAVAHEHDVHKALQHFILGTTAEAIRTIEGRPFDDDVLKFVRYRIQSSTSSAKMATFYTFGEPVPPTGMLRPGIVILTLPPWRFGAGDFELFTARTSFKKGEIDREVPDPNASGSMWNNGTKLWAMLYDTCTVSGYRWFAITTYNHWVFGTWSLNWKAVEVTPAIPCDYEEGMTLAEILTFWTMGSRDKVRYWRIAPNCDD